MFMPRTIDKMRALLPGGNPGCYFIDGQVTGMSGFLLQRLGISAEEMLTAVARADQDADIATWLRERADASTYPEINALLRRIEPRHSGDMEYFRELYGSTLDQHPELVTVLEIIEADDRRMFDDRKASSEPAG
jgi:lipopolysaccharide biosynthesis regulator YciM